MMEKAIEMCDLCSFIQLKKSFCSQNDYENTIDHIKWLIDEKGFIFVEGNCEVGSHMNDSGHWIDDIIYHVIQCPECGQAYRCYADTYHGFGSFKKER